MVEGRAVWETGGTPSAFGLATASAAAGFADFDIGGFAPDTPRRYDSCSCYAPPGGGSRLWPAAGPELRRPRGRSAPQRERVHRDGAPRPPGDPPRHRPPRPPTR